FFICIGNDCTNGGSWRLLAKYCQPGSRIIPALKGTSMKKYLPSIWDYLLIITSSLIQAISLRLFFIPADLASGGVSGISQLINHFTGWPIGLMVFIGNLPLFLLGWRFLGGTKFVMRTAVAIVTY